MKDILIATCGTSILTNKVQRSIKDEIAGDKKYLEMSEDEISKIKNNILVFLETKEAHERDCGAELNSIYYLIENGKFSRKKIYLIVSDSVDGELSGEIIAELLKKKFDINEVIIKKIEKLNIGVEYDFAKKGLRTLARIISEIVKGENANNLIMAPIGGLKAAIIIVAQIGQIFDVPCYYLFEGSKNIIEILPLPISIDINLFLENIEIISELYNCELLEKRKLESFILANPKLKNILEEEVIDGGIYVALTPLGNAGYEKIVNDSNFKLPSPSKLRRDDKKIISKNNEEHARKVVDSLKFKNILEIILDINYVEKIIINYFNPDGKGKQINITKSSNETEGRTLKLKYNDKAGMLEANIFITDNDDEEKIDAARIDILDKIIKC